MILGSDPDRPRVIGERYTGVWIDGEFYPDQPFVVLRESTYEEWLANPAGSEMAEPPRNDEDARLYAESHYYEVSLD
jgi:hypothetical protein